MLRIERHVRLYSSESVLKLLHLILEALKSSLDKCGDFSELLDVVSDGQYGFRFLHKIKFLDLSSSAVLSILSFRGKALGLSENIWNLFSDASIEGVHVIDKTLVDRLTT